jgi:coiled-coil domain-containing protein 55
VYEYDNIYDNISSEKQRRKQIEAEKEKPKYINAIMAAAERRKVEQTFVKEKIEAKKREKEEGESDNKPKFITKAYEAQLAANKKRIVYENQREKYNKVHSVANKEFGMMGFYSSLLTKNKLYSEEKGKEINEEVKKDVILNKIIEKKEENAKFEPIIKEVKEKSIKLQHEVIKEIDSHDSAIDKAEEYKKRYIERKRNRDNN